MTMLHDLLEESDYAEDLRKMQKELNEYSARFKLYEALLVESTDTDNMFDETARMLDAAKRGLGIANRLKTPEDRKKHRSRIMTTMNHLRSQLRNIEQAIAALA